MTATARTGDEVMASAVSGPERVLDELKWDLLRDEWDLLLAVGTGPARVPDVAAQLQLDVSDVQERVALLVEHGLLVEPEPNGFALVDAFYQRQEGMASYLRDLVLRRFQSGDAVPAVAGRVRGRLGGPSELGRLLAGADENLFPSVVKAANRPESPRSERYAVYFAVARDCDAEDCQVGTGLVDNLLQVVRSAALQRNQPSQASSAKLWVAEMRTDPEVADEIGAMFETFLSSAPASSEPGAAAFAIFPSGDLGDGASGEHHA